MGKWMKRVECLLHPHRDRQERLMSRIMELRELSAVAAEIGDRAVYNMLQRQMNEMFCQYLAFAFLDGVGLLIPHVLFMWLLSLRFRIITLPFDLPGLGSQLNIIIWYPISVLIFYLIRRWFKKRYLHNGGVLRWNFR